VSSVQQSTGRTRKREIVTRARRFCGGLRRIAQTLPVQCVRNRLRMERHHDQAMTHDAGVSATDTLKYRALVADGEPRARSLITRALMSSGFAVTEAGDGRVLLDILTIVGPGHFALVVTDHPLRIDGAVRPAVVLTGYDDDGLRSAARESGAALLLKPVNVPVLLELVDGLVFAAERERQR
jgi:CheY-like chemotaxis protein